MAWRFTKASLGPSHTGEYSILLYLNAQDWSHRDHGGALRAEIEGADKVGVSPRGGQTGHLPSGLHTVHTRRRVVKRRWRAGGESYDATQARRRRRPAAAASPSSARCARGGATRRPSPRHWDDTLALPVPRGGAARAVWLIAGNLFTDQYDGAAKRQFQRCLEHLTDPVEKAYCARARHHCAFDGLGDRAAAAQAWRSARELDPASAVRARAGLGMTTTNATERAEALGEPTRPCNSASNACTRGRP